MDAENKARIKAAAQKKVEEASSASECTVPVSYIGSWNRHPQLIAAIVEHIRQGLLKFPAEVRANVPVLFTAHSLPERIVGASATWEVELPMPEIAITGVWLESFSKPILSVAGLKRLSSASTLIRRP